MSRFFPSGNSLIPKVSTWKVRIPSILSKWLMTDSNGDPIAATLTSGTVLIGNVSNAPTEILTQVSNYTIGDFTSTYLPFATESNWQGKIYVGTVIAGTSGDIHFGTFQNGTTGFVVYTGSSWIRYFAFEFIDSGGTLGGLIRSALVTTANWSSSGDFTITNSGYGDVGMSFEEGDYYYLCVSNTASNVHKWIRLRKAIGAEVIISDVTYIPYYTSQIVTNGSSFTIPAKHKIISIVSETQNTTGGNIQAGSTATAEVSQLVITGGSDSDGGTLNIVLNGVTFPIYVAGSQSTTSVASTIRISGFTGYVTGGSGTTITFTSIYFRSETDATFADVNSGVTATMTTTIQGVDAGSDIIAAYNVGTVANVYHDLTYIQLDSMISTSVKTVYFYVSTTTSIKLHIILQKIIS